MGISTGTAILGSAVIGAGTSLLSGGAQEAGLDANAAVQLEGINLNREIYEQTREDQAPWRETGANALGQLGAIYGIGREGMLTPEEMDAAREMFRETPGYEFAFDEGQRALERSAAAGGRLTSGATGRELVRYGQGMADQQFGEYANRLAALAGTGQTATARTGAAGANYGAAATQGFARQGNALAGAGTARGSGYAGVGNALNTGLNNWVFNDALNSRGLPDNVWTSGGWGGGAFNPETSVFG